MAQSMHLVVDQMPTTYNQGKKTVERYELKFNEWTYICETNYVRNGVCACVFMVEYLLLETVMLKTNL